jgi:dihydrofolate reductase
MRRIHFQVASSLDGFIADSDGNYDWIVSDPTIDFKKLLDQFDTLLMGRLTYQTMLASGGDLFGKKVFVFSKTLRQDDHPEVEIIYDISENKINELKQTPGKDIWLFGGGELFRSFLKLGLVDTVELAIIPILLGGGQPFLPQPASRQALTFRQHHVYPSGIVMLEYDVKTKHSSEES